MSATRTLRLDQLLDGADPVVEVRPGADGSVIDAWFAMDGMPRIEPLLVGRPVVEVPGIVERLCGICPAAHHLAGVRALEALACTPPMTPTADALRRLLHHGAVLRTHASRFAGVDPSVARDLSRFARNVVGATGGDSHFPRCAVPGGVVGPLDVARREQLVGQLDQALARALSLLGKITSRQRDVAPMPAYTGHDLALVDEAGALDLYGDRLRAVATDGAVTIAGASAHEWPDLVAESRPGSPASRPYLRSLGTEHGGYRVGPTAQLRAPISLLTPRAEAARRRWLAADGDATWARAVMMLHVVEVIEELLSRPGLAAGPVLVETGPLGTGRREASGWVDGARGLLVHTYRTDNAGTLTGATITTPTAQNEPWLAGLLRSQLTIDQRIDLLGDLPPPLRVALESAVLEADPCLPCTSLPVGRMHLRLRVVTDDAIGAAREGA